jgi:hypothetical protein
MVTFDFNTMLVNMLCKKKCSSGYFKELSKAVMRYCTGKNHNLLTQQTLLISLDLVMTVPGA